ncbi:MAG: hypothetical protein Q7V62_01855, partial [Actinomycetota bacterium]|nr:hypothetical protein [Actinomycetota bacterium]
GTDTETGYYFGIGNNDVALEGRSWVRAEALTPVFCVVLAAFHVWAYLFREWYASKPGALEVLGPLVVACVVTPLQMAQLAVLARIGDAQLVTALVFLALFTDLVLLGAELAVNLVGVAAVNLKSRVDVPDYLLGHVRNGSLGLYALALVGVGVQWVTLWVAAGWQVDHAHAPLYVIGVFACVLAVHAAGYAAVLVRMVRQEPTRSQTWDAVQQVVLAVVLAFISLPASR